MKHEFVDLPVEQRIACLKYLLKKEMSDWTSAAPTAAAARSDSDRGFQAIIFVDDPEQASVVCDAVRAVLQANPPSRPSLPVQPIAPTTNPDATAAGTGGRVSLLSRKKRLAPTATAAVTVTASPSTAAAAAAGEEQKPKNAPAKTSDVVGDDDNVGGGVSYLSDSDSLDERAQALASFRTGASTVLVSSELAARGLDVPSISHVFLMGLPDSVESYLHRAGRAGRLGRAGKVVTFISEEEKFVVQRYSNELGIEISRRAINSRKKSD